MVKTIKNKEKELKRSTTIIIAKIKKENKTLKSIVKQQTEIITKQDEEISDILELKKNIDDGIVQVDLSKILPTNLDRPGILSSTLSDIHGEEIVDPKKLLGLNAYNPDICTKRIRKYFFLLQKEYVRATKELDIAEVHIQLAGDNISNSLHYELAETNALPPMHAMLYIQSLLIEGIKWLAERIGDNVILRINCVTGNHPRTTPKKTYKTRTGNNLEYYAYKVMENYFTEVLTGYNNIKFEVAEGDTIRVILPFIPKNYDHKLIYTLSHGDQFRYLGGVGGIMVPALRWHLQFSKAVPADKRYIGDKHQWMPMGDISINGSVIGYNEYAMGKGLAFEPAIQHVEYIDSMFGFTKKIPLILQD